MSFLIPTGTSQLSACKYLSGASMFDGSVLASMSMSLCPKDANEAVYQNVGQ